MIRPTRQKTLPGIVKKSLRGLQFATIATLAFLTVVNLVVFFQGNGKRVCASIESSYRLRAGALARELSLGNTSTADAIFKEFTAAVGETDGWVAIKIDPPDTSTGATFCRPGLVYASIEVPIEFAGETLGVVRGRIGNFFVLYFCATMLGVFLLLGFFIRMMTRALARNLISEVIDPIRLISVGETMDVENLPVEVAQIQAGISTMKEELREKEAQNQQLLWAKRVAEFAEQVSHDIKAPVATLELSMKELGGVSADHKALMLNSFARIRGILDSLESGQHAKISGKFRDDPVAENSESVGDLLGQIVAEKRLQFGPSSALILDYVASVEASLVEYPGDGSEFLRAVSNVLTNAAEALVNGRGTITVRLFLEAECVRLEIRDDGCGIPENLLARITERGASFGKKTGTGLGLYQVRSFMDAVGGKLEISSELGFGTSVVMLIPVPIRGRPTLVLIDNDPLVRRGWHLKAKSTQQTLLSFSSVQDFVRAAGPIDRSVPIYIDSELDDGVPGEVAAKEIAEIGFGNIVLASGRLKTDLKATPWIKRSSGKDYPECEALNGATHFQ